ncbi:MAG: 2,3,4,5-tetrahydropyridine-2,6-dicarboxylate N-succinyltransferase, partial [bacterium]|nr:2,3,4,5-tetrahydropyridine-2,6-dicarboxylate N-succinyltransferase [bacterium]
MTQQEELNKFHALVADLESGKVRVAEKIDGEWKVNAWVKETILSGFRLGNLTDMSEGQFSFFDKD